MEELAGIFCTAYFDLQFLSFLLQAVFSLCQNLKNPGGDWTDNKIIYTKNISSTFILCYTEYIAWCVPKNHQQLSVFNKMVCKNHSEDFIWSAWSNVVSFCLHIWNYIFISISKKKKNKSSNFYWNLFIFVRLDLQHLLLHYQRHSVFFQHNRTICQIFQNCPEWSLCGIFWSCNRNKMLWNKQKMEQTIQQNSLLHLSNFIFVIMCRDLLCRAK